MFSESLFFNIHPEKVDINISREEFMDRQDDLVLPSPWFAVGIRVTHRICSNTTPMDEVKIHTSFNMSCIPSDRILASVDELRAIVEGLLSRVQIPFSIDRENGEDRNLYWKEVDSSERIVPLHSLDDVVGRISEAAARLAHRAVATRHKLANMLVAIDKQTVIRHDEFEKLFGSSSGGNKNMKPRKEVKMLCSSSKGDNENMEDQATFHDHHHHHHVSGCVEDEDDFDYYDEYRAIEDRLLDGLDRRHKQRMARPTGGSNPKTQRTNEVATMITEKEDNGSRS